MKKPYFKYIIIGAGTSGLHLIKSISEDKFFRKEKILLIDKSLKKTSFLIRDYFKDSFSFNSYI